MIITTEEEKLPVKLIQEVSNGSWFAIHIKDPSVFTAVMLLNKNGVKLENNQQFLMTQVSKSGKKNIILMKGQSFILKKGSAGKNNSC